ncbi:hypothetical protein HF690_14960 [Oleiagrimonas citrea]|uniref:TonB C-terminal domain-containing protein n=1 Tax=Oleiagrimonas citrea TaxID=1665687 RepID=A0A846ZQQ0_9GAMM|nr:energy transducer TonB [Oleiagrimonas citrea]NKZ40252.1 hypothetical protein [Oleiagrimonas citrea]
MIGAGFILILASKHATVMSDCGARDNSRVIEVTKSLVVKKGELVVPVSELSTKVGRRACVRLSFAIGRDGKAANIEVVESHGSFPLNVNAVAALKKYSFVKPALISSCKRLKKYSLVFSVIVDKAPPFPSRKSIDIDMIKK